MNVAMPPIPRVRLTEADRNAVRDSGSYVYVIFCEDAGAIKVGRARDPECRLRDLQVGNPLALVLLRYARGGERTERELHGALAADWIRGEWFRLTDHAVEVIEMMLPWDRTRR